VQAVPKLEQLVQLALLVLKLSVLVQGRLLQILH